MQPQLIFDMIETQARRFPARKAAIFRDRELTYGELLHEVEQLSNHLKGHGVVPDSVVAICVERSLEMLIAMLAILRAGGAYLPLDPGFPSDRVNFMLADSGATIVVTQSTLASRFSNNPVESILMDQPLPDDERRIAAEARRNPSNLAYLMYTSGSTGTPKGVMIEHRNLVNFCLAMDEVLGTEPGVWLAVTSISFDISVLELLWTLARGFTVVIQSDEEKLLTAGDFAIAAQLQRHRITHLQCTPTMAEQLIRRPQIVDGLRSLRKLLLGGEALPVSLAEFLTRTVEGDVLNMYGPTETTIWSTTAPIEAGRAITIGRPIRNTQIFIIGENGDQCPVGEVGEIFIGGDGVARGYWKREQLTAERFVTRRFGDTPDNRFYRTGDLGRIRDDGTIEFLGRVDHQIKIRGYRVELGEIETVLCGHPAIRQAIVVPFEHAGAHQLAAYVVAEDNRRIGADELRSHASHKLPDYMIPATFVFLQALPTTPNGKVDRKALPAPRGSQAAQGIANITAPASLIERKIAAVLGDALGIATVGLNQNFFELGATSLIAAEAAAALRESLNHPLKVTDLFAHPTVSALALFVSRGEPGTSPSERGAERGAARLAALRERRRALEAVKHEA